uniref:Arabidopsis retrotransposon Orf1 C-terminal domain-containing protein n=1 Tax=Beta vulgaris TaxID=161934 RepID=E2DN00_BETVU|nr:hypothetical protein [Beta vulgaris]
MFTRRRRSTTGSQPPPPPPEIPRDETFPDVIFSTEEQRERFQRLKGREVSPTTFLDIEFLDKLGIHNEFKEFMKIIGMEPFYTVHVNTYPVLVYEFYSSLNVTHPRSGPISHVSYRLLNRDFTLTLPEFARILRVLNRGEIGHPPDYHHRNVYYAITGDETDFTLQHCHARYIHQPIFKIWVRFMSKTLFGRVEGQLIRGDELYLIGSYMYRGTPRRFHYNIPHHVALQMERIATTYPKRRADGTFSSRPIVNGGLVTLFARAIPDFDETQYQPALGPTLLDYAYLTRLHWLERGGDTYKWQINGMRSIDLPSPLAKIKPGQPHDHLPIAGSDFPTPRPEIPERTYYRRPHVEDIPSSSDAPPPPYSTAPPSFDFQEMMTLLHRMDTGITANTAAIQGISQQVDANGALLQNLSQRVDTLANDQHLALYSMYDENCRLHRIAEHDAHPSWYTWNPNSQPGPEVDGDDASEDVHMDD